MKKCVKPLLSLIGSVIALLMAHYINIFSYMTFIPDDKSYDVCIAVYFTLFESMIGTFINWCERKYEESMTEIEAVIYLQNEVVNEKTTPIIRFDDMGMAEMRLHIKLCGKCENVKGNQIIIRSFLQAEMQLVRRGTGAKIDNDGSLLIDIGTLCGNRAKIQCEEDYKIVLQRGVIDNSLSINLIPEINIVKKNRRVKYKANEAKIILEEN